jgi:phospholipase/carboxylesterase
MSDAPLDLIHHCVPAAAGEAATLLLLHGTGGDGSDLLPLGRAIDSGAALPSPRGKMLERHATLLPPPGGGSVR